MKIWPRLCVLIAVAALGAATSARASDAGFLVVSGGSLGQADSAVILLDVGSVTHAGDAVTASMAMVVVEPELGRVPGVSYMLGQERLSCRDRTSQTVHVEVYADGGAKLTEFDAHDAPQRIADGTAWAEILNRACRGGSLVDAGVTPFADLNQGVSAVRASVDAARAAQGEMSPHRFEPLGFLPRNDGRSTMAFVDQAQLEHDGAALTRWMLLAHATPRLEDQTPVAYDLVQLSFDCTGRRTRVRVWLSFGQNNALVRSSVELGPWEGVGDPGTPGARQMSAVCTDNPAAGEVSFDSIRGAMGYVRAQASGGPARIS